MSKNWGATRDEIASGARQQRIKIASQGNSELQNLAKKIMSQGYTLTEAHRIIVGQKKRKNKHQIWDFDEIFMLDTKRQKIKTLYKKSDQFTIELKILNEKHYLTHSGAVFLKNSTSDKEATEFLNFVENNLGKINEGGLNLISSKHFWELKRKFNLKKL